MYLAFFPVLGPVCPCTIEAFLPSFLSRRHSHDKRYQALSRFSVLQVTESWAGPGYEAKSSHYVVNDQTTHAHSVSCKVNCIDTTIVQLHPGVLVLTINPLHHTDWLCTQGLQPTSAEHERGTLYALMFMNKALAREKEKSIGIQLSLQSFSQKDAYWLEGGDMRGWEHVLGDSVTVHICVR